MIAEDEALERKALNFLVEKFYKDKIRVVCEAANGRDAVEKALEYKPDIILMDIRMPMMDGLKASDLIVNLRKTLEKTTGPAYFFVHLSNLDTIAHQYGPQSEEYYTELSLISSLLKNNLVNKIDTKTSKETILLLTSDHGELDVIPEKTTYLNHFPELLKNLQYNKRGTPILPTGSPRDIFLHVKKERKHD